MKAADLTDKQLKAAEQYIRLRHDGDDLPLPEERIIVQWKQLVMLVAEYGAIRAQSISRGGSVEEPGEVYRTRATARKL